MNRIKVSEFIASISGLCCFAIALGIFLPFVKVEIWGYDLMKISIFEFITDKDIQELIGKSSYADEMFKAILFFGIAFVASLIAENVFKTSISLVPAIIMIIAALVGKYMVDELASNVFQFGAAKKLIGSTLLTWGYKALLFDSIAAFIVNFYLNYVSGGTSQLANAINNIAKATSTSGSASVKCPGCGKINASGNSFCNSCGVPLPKINNPTNEQAVQSTWFCSKCGAENSANSRFCDSCGNSKP